MCPRFILMCGVVRDLLLWTRPRDGHQGRRVDQEVWRTLHFCRGELHTWVACSSSCTRNLLATSFFCWHRGNILVCTSRHLNAVSFALSTSLHRCTLPRWMLTWCTGWTFPMKRKSKSAWGQRRWDAASAPKHWAQPKDAISQTFTNTQKVTDPPLVLQSLVSRLLLSLRSALSARSRGWPVTDDWPRE